MWTTVAADYLQTLNLRQHVSSAQIFLSSQMLWGTNHLILHSDVTEYQMCSLEAVWGKPQTKCVNNTRSNYQNIFLLCEVKYFWAHLAVLGRVAGIVINISNWPLTWHSLHRVTALVCPVLQSHVIVSVSASCQYQVTTGTGCSGQWWSLTIISDSLIIIVTFYLPTFLIIIILPITSRTGHLQQQKYLIRISGVLPPPVGKYLVQCRNIIVTDSARADDWSC